jgi:hypothetical protein
MRLIYSNEESLILTITPEHTDAFIPSWYELKYSVAVQTGPVHSQRFTTNHCCRTGDLPGFASAAHTKDVTRYDPSAQQQQQQQQNNITQHCALQAHEFLSSFPGNFWKNPAYSSGRWVQQLESRNGYSWVANATALFLRRRKSLTSVMMG